MKTMGVFLLVVFWGIGIVSGAQDFVRVDGVDDNLYSVEVSPVDKNIWAVGSENAIFLSRDGGKSLNKVFVIKSDNSKVNDILFDKENKNRIYFATGAGLYITEDLGDSFERIFSEYKEESYVGVLSVYKKDNVVYLGTEQGLYKSGEDVYDFKRIISVSQEAIVNDIIEGFQDRLIMATSQGVFISSGSEQNDFKRTFVSRDYKDGQIRNQPLSLVQDQVDLRRVYLGTSQGVFLSEDNGESWQKIEVFGLSGLSIKDIKVNRAKYSELFLGTDNGLYLLDIDENKLDDVSRQSLYYTVRDIYVDQQGIVLVAADRGFYVKGVIFDDKDNLNRVKRYFKCEPTYMQVQEAALRYNEVHPKQIKRWRNSLKYRALFPTLKLDYDKTIYGTAGGATYDGKAFVGPRDWGASLSWDMGDLVWNSYQDDIDTKSRLKTQTRIDILDDLRRIYFERKKVKLNLINNKSLSEAEYLKKELYLEELTAALDSYTGGYFSRECRELRRTVRK